MDDITMTQSTPVPEAVIEAAYSGEPLDNRPPEAMDGRTVQYIYSYGYSTGRSHAAEAVRRAALTSPPKAEAGEPEPFAWYLTGIDGRMSQVSDRIGDRDAWLSIGYVVKPLYATPEPRGDVRVTDELIGTALIAWDKLAGYSKIERMRAALEAVLNPGATTP